MHLSGFFPQILVGLTGGHSLLESRCSINQLRIPPDTASYYTITAYLALFKQELINLLPRVE
ncbi:hypothetical protein CEXT_341661, partial [Caerostris extrusa]